LKAALGCFGKNAPLSLGHFSSIKPKAMVAKDEHVEERG